MLRRRVSRPRRVKRKIGRRRIGGRKLRLGRGMNANRDRATVVEVQEYAAVPEGGSLISHSLNQFA